MEKNLSTSSSSRVLPWGGLLALLLISICELALTALPSSAWEGLLLATYPSRDDALRVRALAETWRPPPETLKVMLLGSSQMRDGVDAPQLGVALASAIGKSVSVRNFGVSGGRTADFLLMSDLFKQLKPDVVVLLQTTNLFYYREATERIKYYSYSLASLRTVAAEYGAAAVVDRKWRPYFIDALLVDLIPSYRAFRAYYLDRIVPRWWRLSPRARLLLFDLPRKNAVAPSRKKVQQQMQDPLPLPLQAAEERLFERLLDRLESLGHPTTIIVDGPNYPGFSPGSKQAAQVEERYADFISRVSKQRGIRHLSRQDLPVFSGDEFSDVLHLTPDGRAKFTDFLAGEILRRLASNS